MLTPQRRLDVYVLLETLASYLRGTRDVGRALRFTLRAAMEFFEAEAGCIAVLAPGRPAAEVAFSLPERREWPAPLLTDFILASHPQVPTHLLLAPLRRRRRAWGVLALSRAEGGFQKGHGQELSRIATDLSETIERIDRERLSEVRARIDRKIMEELRPKDLFYQILDGLRSLTRYDHSSALLIRYPHEQHLRLEAEQIAWKKGKSQRIGLRLPLSTEVQAILEAGEVYGFERGEGWEEWEGRPVAGLARLLDYNRAGAAKAAGDGGDSGTANTTGDGGVGGRTHSKRDGGDAASHAAAGYGSPEDGDRPEASMLCVTLAARAGAFGVLKIASSHPRTFGRYEAELLDGFRSQASIAIQNSLRTESLQVRMLEAERKHAMADLARGVAHDVNNALGAALPLVQQIRADLGGGGVNPGELTQDMEEVEASLQLCRRIFGGMLAFARNAARTTSEADVAHAVRSALKILKDSLDRRGIGVVLELPGNLPPVGGGQSDLERIFFNLISNARDGMAIDGRLCVRARHHGNGVEVLVEDNGRGIPPDDLPHVQEPFFTTKSRGHGLGLSICRSILWQMGGDMSIESKVGEGTRVRLRIPRAAAGEEGGA